MDSHSIIGTEFVHNANLPPKKYLFHGDKAVKKTSVTEITVILLDGRKWEILCSPKRVLTGKLLEFLLHKEKLEDCSVTLGLSALLFGDFVFLPPDMKIHKVMRDGCNGTLYLRIMCLLPSLKSIPDDKSRHLLYLQLRRSVLEHQLPGSSLQIVELNGFALQAEFGDWHESLRNYFRLEHYLPETMINVSGDKECTKIQLIRAHLAKKGLNKTLAEDGFIAYAQSLPLYGGHFYSATWLLEDNNKKDVWLYVGLRGLHLYERCRDSPPVNPQLHTNVYEVFEWKKIQTLSYTKCYFCISPYTSLFLRAKLKKYKLKMDHQKNYFAFRLASLHHQFFMSMKKNSMLPVEASIPSLGHDHQTICSTENNVNDYQWRLQVKDGRRKITPDNPAIKRSYFPKTNARYEYDKENEKPRQNCKYNLTMKERLIEENKGDSKDPKALLKVSPRSKKRSKKTLTCNESTQAVDWMPSLKYTKSSSTSHSSLDTIETLLSEGNHDAYVLDSAVNYVNDSDFLPDFREEVNLSLANRLDDLSFAEERVISTIVLVKDQNHGLGLHVMEGSDGNVYIESVIEGGPAFHSQTVAAGDRIVAVNGHSLLGRGYNEALELLKNTKRVVELVLSKGGRASSQTKESRKISANDSCKSDQSEGDRAVIIDYIPKSSAITDEPLHVERSVKSAIPKSLGLGRKWNGPVRYPVTPMKKTDFFRARFANDASDRQVFL